MKKQKNEEIREYIYRNNLGYGDVLFYHYYARNNDNLSEDAVKQFYHNLKRGSLDDVTVWSILIPILLEKNTLEQNAQARLGRSFSKETILRLQEMGMEHFAVSSSSDLVSFHQNIYAYYIFNRLQLIDGCCTSSVSPFAYTDRLFMQSQDIEGYLDMYSSIYGMEVVKDARRLARKID